MSLERKPITFNGPLEAGIRAVSILAAAFPQTYDLQRLVALDYLLVHTGDINGPDNLHPPTPMHIVRAVDIACVDKKVDRKSTRLNSSHQIISYAVFCL